MHSGDRIYIKEGKMKQGIDINLWFNNNAEEAVDFYLSVFRDGKITGTEYYTEAGEEITGHKKGDIVTIEFELLGTCFVAVNAGPEFTFSPAVSFSVKCKTQEEIDYYWNKLSAVPDAEQCGWLQDKYGLSWQIVPVILIEMMERGNQEQRKRITEKYLGMKKFIIKDLEEAFDSDGNNRIQK